MRRWYEDTDDSDLPETGAMKRQFDGFGSAVATLALGVWACCAQAASPPARPSIPYVATRNDAVRDMLWSANVGKDDVVYDLGSGDGRIVVAAVRDFDARRAIGVEIDPARVKESRENARQAGVADRVEFVEGDLFTNDLHQATVVTLFLGHQPNIKLRPRLLRLLQPGTRIVSHQFGMGEWRTDKSLTTRTVYLGMWGEMWSPFRDNLRVPDYSGNEMHYGTSDNILMWIVPAPVAGVWRGKVETDAGPQDLSLVLHQRLSDVNGVFQLVPQTNRTGKIRADLWGDHLRFASTPSAARFQLRFDGHVRDNTMRGTLAITDGKQMQESKWQARREPVDVSGTWEWPCLAGDRSVRLKVDRRDGVYSVAYIDRNRSIPVTDFYNHGGGLYFTLLVGRESNGGLRITEDTGWLLGEAVLQDGALKGTIEFHPYGDMSGIHHARKPAKTVTRGWRPKRVQSSESPR